jgi:hypothetical protein
MAAQFEGALRGAAGERCDVRDDLGRVISRIYATKKRDSARFCKFPNPVADIQRSYRDHRHVL